jgi:hypothetical protein
MASGVTVDDSCVDTYNDFKMKKVPSKFLTFKVGEQTERREEESMGSSRLLNLWGEFIVYI